LEKLSHLEDKLYRAVELFKRERREREVLETEAEALRREVSQLVVEKARLEEQIQRLYGERDEIRGRVESMLEAIAVLEAETAGVAE
jgi:predicted nuclease with TOPRIM domain